MHESQSAPRHPLPQCARKPIVWSHSGHDVLFARVLRPHDHAATGGWASLWKPYATGGLPPNCHERRRVTTLPLWRQRGLHARSQQTSRLPRVCQTQVVAVCVDRTARSMSAATACGCET